MKVFMKSDLSLVLDRLSEETGRIYGPIRRLGGDSLFSSRTAEELEIDDVLPVNSPKDVLLTELTRVIKSRGQDGEMLVSDPIILFAVRTCDLAAIKKLEKKLEPEVSPGFLLKNICSLVVANACMYQEVNCFCKSVGLDPMLANDSDLQLFDSGEKIYLEIKTERGAKAVGGLAEFVRDLSMEEEKELVQLKHLPFTNPLPDVACAVEITKKRPEIVSAPGIDDESCIVCGACSFACPSYAPWMEELIAELKSEISASDSVSSFSRRADRCLPYGRMIAKMSEADDGMDCVGCGRCVTLCPSGLGMIEFIDSLSGFPKRHDPRKRDATLGAMSWYSQVRNKIVTPLQAFEDIRPGESVFIASGCAEPQHLARAFMKNYRKFLNVQVIHLLSMGSISFEDPELTDHIRLNSFFVGDQSREAVAMGQADYTPVFLSQLPEMLRSGQIKVDVALIQVSPPDSHGYCTLGISVETIRAAVECARYIVAQINPKMPRTRGDSAIHLDQIHAVLPYEENLIEWRPPPLDEESRKIGQYIAQLIDDGATLQIGIGKIGQALLPFLVEKKDLGIHTQIITDEVINLMQKGVVNNKRKRLHVGKTIATFAVGTRKMYQKLDHNPSVGFYPMDYVSHPHVIAQNYKMTSINSAFEVDLTGQVCADSISHQFYSGIASMADYLRGAGRSEGGKPIVALPSTAKNGTISRICPSLSEGVSVVGNRGDVHYVVTEYGIAYLHGKSIRERAMALIEIAHPKFRSGLLEEAKKKKYIFKDQELPSLTKHVYPEEWETSVVLENGKEMFLRPIKATDETALQKLYYSLKDQDVFLRFMGTDPHFPHRRMQALTVVDYEERMAVVATLGPIGREEILGIGRYEKSPNSDIAEVAFTVREEMRRMRIGASLLEHLTVIARNKGVKGFRAEILMRNKAMMGLFKTSGAQIHSRIEDGMYTMWYDFDKVEKEADEEK